MILIIYYRNDINYAVHSDRFLISRDWLIFKLCHCFNPLITTLTHFLLLVLYFVIFSFNLLYNFISINAIGSHI